MPVKRRSGSSKNPPILSHEFFIQNHADIVSCIAMIFIVGLLFQATSPISSMFIVMSHNATEMATGSGVLYTYGIKDLAFTFFYFLICIVMHAVVQEYLLDKINRRLHLSKRKQYKFNESGQLLIFYLVSLAWSLEIMREESYLIYISKLWMDYPHTQMGYLFKFYFIIQIAYWLHTFPQLYLQKAKKDQILPTVIHSSLYLAFFTAAYLLNFTRIALCLSILHYCVEVVFHFSRLFYFAEKTQISEYGFKLWNILFVFVRLASICLSVLTFWYGLAQNESGPPSIETGNFNTHIIRINCLLALFVLQAWMMWNFTTFHLKRVRERALEAAAKKKSAKGSAKKNRKEDDVNELPEVDQNAKKLTQRAATRGKARH